MRRSVAYKIFRGAFKSWTKLYEEAAEFASELGDERLISITTGGDHGVVVWYYVR